MNQLNFFEYFGVADLGSAFLLGICFVLCVVLTAFGSSVLIMLSELLQLRNWVKKEP